MKEKALEKEIDHQRDIKNNLWNSLIVTVAGTIGLSFSPDNTYQIILIIIGIVLSGLFFFAYFKKDIFIDYLIEKIEKGE